MRMFKTLVFASLALFVVAGNVSAQAPFSPKPDNRYKGYPASLVAWPKSMPTPQELAACAASKPYEPVDIHLTKYVSRLKIANVRVQNTDECVFMRVAGGNRWVLRVKGTKVGQDEMNRDLVDLGSPTGLVCDNSRAFSIPVNVPPLPPTRITTEPPVNPAPAPIIRGVPRVPRMRPTPPPYTPLPPPPVKPVITPQKSTAYGISVGLAGLKGWSETTYECVDPNKCDATQLHETQALVLSGQGNYGRVFGEGSASIVDKDTKIRFDDPVPKRRDLELTSDKFWTLEGGYEHPLNEALKVRIGARVDSYQVLDHYFAPVETSVKLTYLTYGVVLGLNGESGSISYGVSGLYEPWGHRDRTGTQAGFPDVQDARQDAKLYGVTGDIEVRAGDHFGVFVDGGWFHRSSFRPGPASNAGNELPNLKHVSGGVRVYLHKPTK